MVKSISKSYGVPGLRLGVLASGDQDLIAALKKDVAIWNINSFAEFYMQIEEKYKKDYARSLELIRAERARFRRELEKLPNLRVIPSQANYLMVELLGGLSARAITRDLLVNRCILVKDLSPKLGGQQYLRLAVRDTRDNDRLLEPCGPCAAHKSIHSPPARPEGAILCCAFSYHKNFCPLHMLICWKIRLFPVDTPPPAVLYYY